MSLLWAIAFGICPQRPSHSLFLGGQQMPIEARMAGIFGGFVVGVVYLGVMGRGRAWRMPDNRMTMILIGFVVLMGLDGINAFLSDLHLPHLYTPNVALRLGTGLLTGLAISGFMVPSFNATVWQSGLEISPLRGVWDLLGGILAEGIYFATALSGAKIWLYPVSVVAILGVLVLTGIIASILLAAILGKTNRATRLTEALPLTVGGLIAAALLLGAMSAVRYALFGLGPLELPI